MTPPAAPLERRYRRLLRLLPPDHRAARGDELLGVLLDLDAGRTRPSPRQALGVTGLALRLRLRGHATVWVLAVATAITVAIDLQAWLANSSIQWGSHRFDYSDAVLDLMLPGLLRALAAVAWSRNAHRAALLFCCALGALRLHPVDLLVLALLLIAPAGWRPYAPWATAAWTFASITLSPLDVTDGRFSVAVCTATATGVVVHLAARDRPRPLLTGALASLVICTFTPIVALAAGSPFQILWCAIVALVTMLATPFAVLSRAVASINRR